MNTAKKLGMSPLASHGAGIIGSGTTLSPKSESGKTKDLTIQKYDPPN